MVGISLIASCNIQLYNTIIMLAHNKTIKFSQNETKTSRLKFRKPFVNILVVPKKTVF